MGRPRASSQNRPAPYPGSQDTRILSKGPSAEYRSKDGRGASFLGLAASLYSFLTFSSLVLIAPAERPLYNRLCTLTSRRRIRHMIDDPFIDFIQHCMLRGTLLFVLFIVNSFSRYRGISSTCME